MSEQIKLRVPSKPAAEYVSQGNHSAELIPKSVITVDNRRFADFLVNEYACAEVDGDHDPFEDEYAADFPGRKVFIAAKTPIVDLRMMDRDQLLAIEGVGEKTADGILEYFAAETADRDNATGEPGNSNEGGDADAGGNE